MQEHTHLVDIEAQVGSIGYRVRHLVRKFALLVDFGHRRVDLVD